MTPEKKSRKGTFDRTGLPVAARYLRPLSRNPMVWLGLALGIAFAGLAGLAGLRGNSTLLSGGPLSSAHAVLEQDCASCHSGFSAVSNEACSTCHEKLGDELGRYTFAAHYVYRSGDFERIVPSEHEMSCATCHTEHGGRRADITRVADQVCATCHEPSDFTGDHPEFAFVSDPDGDDDAIAFAHGHHVREILESRGYADLERACLDCHQPEPSGRGFLAIDFDVQCDTCHLDAGVATPRLAVSAPGTDSIGVETLEAVQASGAAGTDWSFYIDPNEFRLAGGGRLVSKTPLHHEDPWVLHNLRQLRQRVFPDAGLADLLVTTSEVSEDRQVEVYAEALATLEEYARGLRGSASPEVQADLARIETLLGEIENALDDPSTPFDPTELLLAFEQPAELDPEIRQEIDLLAADLTSACTQCHTLENFTFARADADQSTLQRAEFDHRSHIIQRRCLDCHGQLPILEAVSGEEIPPELDRSAIHNLPRIASCQECHSPGLTADSCSTCHLFHPHAGDHQGDLLLVQDL